MGRMPGQIFKFAANVPTFTESQTALLKETYIKITDFDGPGMVLQGSWALLAQPWGGRAGCVLEPSWGRSWPSWSYLGLSLDRFGAILGDFLDRLGGLLVRPGPSWEPLGTLLGGLGAVLGASWAVLGRLGAIWGDSGAVLVRLEAVFGASWAVLRASWANLGPSWAVLGPPWGRLGAIPQDASKQTTSNQPTKRPDDQPTNQATRRPNDHTYRPGGMCGAIESAALCACHRVRAC